MARKKKKSLLKRLIIAVAGLLALLVLSLFLVGNIWLKPLVKKAVETYGPEAVGAPVEVEEVSIGLFGGMAKVKGLMIGNPEGFKEPVAIEAESFEINLQLRSLMTDTVVIRDIHLEKPVITYEKGRDSNNLMRLQENALAWAKSLSSGDEGPSRKVIIERFRMTGGTLRVKLPGLPAVPIKLSDIERTQIGGSGSDATNFGYALQDMLASLQLNASGSVEKAGDAIRKAGEDALKAGLKTGEDALKAGEKVLDGAGDKLKGLFGK